MLLYNNNLPEKLIYNRMRHINLRFTSIFNNRLKKDRYTYSCDEEFFSMLYKMCYNNTILQNEIAEIKQYCIFVETLPKEIQQFLYFDTDIVLAFKAYLGLDDLDRLVKK